MIGMIIHLIETGIDYDSDLRLWFDENSNVINEFIVAIQDVLRLNEYLFVLHFWFSIIYPSKIFFFTFDDEFYEFRKSFLIDRILLLCILNPS